MIPKARFRGHACRRGGRGGDPAWSPVAADLLVDTSLLRRGRRFVRVVGRGVSNRLVISMRLARVVLLALPLFAFVRAAGAQPAAAPPPAPATELPVKKIPNVGAAAEFCFAPDSFHVIGNAKREGDASYHVYVANIDGGDIRRLNDVGDDACSFFFPDGKRVIWTSTRDHPELDKGSYSDPRQTLADASRRPCRSTPSATTGAVCGASPMTPGRIGPPSRRRTGGTVFL